MNIEPISNAGLIIQIHVFAAMAAFLLGGFVLWRRKGTPMHRLLGRLWVGLMVIIAVSSFFIHELKTWGQFSPIHLISIGTLCSLFWSIVAIKRGNVQAHKCAMLGVYIGGLGIAGAMSFLPGRILHQAVFAEPAGAGIGRAEAIWLAFIGMAAGFAIVALLTARKPGI